MYEMQYSFHNSPVKYNSSAILFPVILYCLLSLVAHFTCIIPDRGKARVDAGPSGVLSAKLRCVQRVVQSSGVLLMLPSVVLFSMG